MAIQLYAGLSGLHVGPSGSHGWLSSSHVWPSSSHVGLSVPSVVLPWLSSSQAGPSWSHAGLSNPQAGQSGSLSRPSHSHCQCSGSQISCWFFWLPCCVICLLEIN
jgi:hypothetical protein